jgi:hypothetical protein
VNSNLFCEGKKGNHRCFTLTEVIKIDNSFFKKMIRKLPKTHCAGAGDNGIMF